MFTQSTRLRGVLSRENACHDSPRHLHNHYQAVLSDSKFLVSSSHEPTFQQDST